MGNSACGCNRDEGHKVIMYEVRHDIWANAVNNLSLSGVKMLHQQEPEIINSIVTKTGYIAIHIAVKRKAFDLFQYLLKHGGHINALCGYDGYTCLHLAVINKDMQIIGELFNCDIDDTVTNNNGKTAADLITDTSFRRQYMRAKNNNRYHKTDTNRKLIQHLDTSIGGMLISDLTNMELQNVLKDSMSDIVDDKSESGDDYNMIMICENEEIYNKKYMEISLRNSDVCLTKFSEKIGCEVDEIAHSLQTLKENNKLALLWDKWVNKNKITKMHDLLKVIYGLTVLTLRNRRNNNNKPPSQPIKLLTNKIYKMLPKHKLCEKQKYEKEKRRHVLTRKEFIEHFHIYLYNAHQQFENEQRQRCPNKLKKIT